MSVRTFLPADLGPIETNALLCGGVAPRPIALASTLSADGVRNLSPFSFYNAFGTRRTDSLLATFPMCIVKKPSLLSWTASRASGPGVKALYCASSALSRESGKPLSMSLSPPPV